MKKSLEIQPLIKEIRDLFPEIKWHDAKFSSAGWDYDVLFLDNKYTTRIPKNEEAENRVNVDFYLLEQIKKQISADIPEPLVKSDKKKIAIYKMVHGSTVSKNKFKYLTSIQKNNLAKRLATFITELHRVNTSELKKHGVPMRAIISQENNIKKLADKITPAITKEDREVVKLFLQNRNRLIHDIDLKLTHGDLNHDHILLDRKNGQVGIIDFSDTAIADPARDFAGLFVYGPKFVKKVIGYYQGSNKEKILERALLYYQEVALIIMDMAIRDSSLTDIRDAKKFFKTRFKKGHSKLLYPV